MSIVKQFTVTFYVTVLCHLICYYFEPSTTHYVCILCVSSVYEHYINPFLPKPLCGQICTELGIAVRLADVILWYPVV